MTKKEKAEMFTDWCKWNQFEMSKYIFKNKWKLFPMECHTQYWDRGLQERWLEYIKFNEKK